LVKDWPDLPANYVMGNPTGIGIDSNQDIFVFHRVKRAWSLIRPMPQSFIAENTILQLDNKSGKMINSWGADLFIMPHGLTVDKNNNVWVTDVALHQVFKFSHDGKLLMKLGEAKVAGNDSAHFNQPTDVAIAPDGSFYVSDGYGNNRVIKFSSSGNYLFEWGTKGDQAGQFNVPHAIDLDSVGNVYVADRENSRVQIFDSNGKYLSGWKNTDQNGKIYSVAVNKQRDEFILIDYATDFFIVPSRSDIIFGLKHKYPQRFAQSGVYDGTVSRYHDVAIDNEGNIYTGDILNNRVLKFRPRN
jgi:peptidylamidoglycolate lyase